MSSEKQQAPTTRRYSPEFKERAVRMVRQLREETGEKQGTIGRVASQLGCGTESLRTWGKQAETDRGEAAGVTTGESEERKELQRAVRAPGRANEIRRKAPADVAQAALDRPRGSGGR